MYIYVSRLLSIYYSDFGCKKYYKHIGPLGDVVCYVLMLRSIVPWHDILVYVVADTLHSSSPKVMTYI